MTNGFCSVCNRTKLLRKDGMVPIHGKCEGGGQEPKMLTVSIDAQLMKEFTRTSTPVKTGYTPEDLHEMLDGLTPKRKKLRQRLSARWHSFRKNVEDYFNGAWDVFDDE